MKIFSIFQWYGPPSPGDESNLVENRHAQHVSLTISFHSISVDFFFYLANRRRLKRFFSFLSNRFKFDRTESRFEARDCSRSNDTFLICFICFMRHVLFGDSFKPIGGIHSFLYSIDSLFIAKILFSRPAGP